jgi:hypothetical protein
MQMDQIKKAEGLKLKKGYELFLYLANQSLMLVKKKDCISLALKFGP